MAARLPVLARRRPRGRGWFPGIPLHPLPPPELEPPVDDLPCWHRRDPDTLDAYDAAMRWTPGYPIVRFSPWLSPAPP